MKAINRNEENIQTVNERKCWFFEKNKQDRQIPLNLTKRQRHNMQFKKIRNKK